MSEPLKAYIEIGTWSYISDAEELQVWLPAIPRVGEFISVAWEHDDDDGRGGTRMLRVDVVEYSTYAVDDFDGAPNDTHCYPVIGVTEVCAHCHSEDHHWSTCPLLHTPVPA